MKHGKNGKLGKHISVHKDLKHGLAKISELPYVDRVIVHRHFGARHKFTNGTIKLARMGEGGVYLRGYHGNGITDIFVKINCQNIQKLLETICDY